MKVLFYSTVYPHSSAPVRGTFNWQLCHALAKQDDVRVVSPRSWLDSLRTLHEPRVRLNTALPTAWPCFAYPPKILKHTYGRWMWHCTRGTVQSLCRDWSPDWVVSYWAHPDGEAGLSAARLLGAKSAVIIGGSDVLLLPKSPRRRQCVVDVLTQSDAVITVCDGLRDAVIDLGANPDRVHCVYQGVDRQQFRQGDQAAARSKLNFPPEAPVFLWVGRMVELKRVDVILQALARVRDVLPDARLCLCGIGPMRDQLEELCQRLSLQDGVRFVGAVAPAELPLWYQAANATVLASTSEGLPNVLRESLACGTPFVATDVGSVCEIADPSHSVLVPVNDVGTLSRAMLDVLDPIFADGAKSYVAESWDDCASQLCHVLEQATQPTGDREWSRDAKHFHSSESPVAS